MKILGKPTKSLSPADRQGPGAAYLLHRQGVISIVLYCNCYVNVYGLLPNLTTPTHTQTLYSRIQNKSVGVISASLQSDRLPVPSHLPGGCGKPGGSFTRVYDPGARYGLRGTPVGFSPGALLMRCQSPLGILTGKLLKIGIVNDVAANGLSTTIYKFVLNN